MRNLMSCPQCQETMISESFGGTWLEVCASCRGLWFDRGELRKLDPQDQGGWPTVERALCEEPSERPAGLRFDCPLCEVGLERSRHEGAPEIEYDECPNCRGLFLRAGEMARLRQNDADGDRERQARILQILEQTKERARQREESATARNASVGLLFFLTLFD